MTAKGLVVFIIAALVTIVIIIASDIGADEARYELMSGFFEMLGDIRDFATDTFSRASTTTTDNEVYVSTSDVVRGIGNIAGRYENYQCEKASQSIQNYLTELGLEFEVVSIQFWDIANNRLVNSNVSSFSRGFIVSVTGFHVGVLFKYNVHCNIHPFGLPLEEWLNDFVSLSGFGIVTPDVYQGLKWRHSGLEG